MSVLSNIVLAIPPFKYGQDELAGFMCRLFQYGEEQEKRMKLLYSRSSIKSRHSVIPDFSGKMEDRDFFPHTSNLEPFPDIEQRMRYFNKSALPFSISAISECLNEFKKEEITHLITVSCTGISAPGIDIEIIQHLKLNANINRTSVNFMGCYAAIHALKQADYICRSQSNAVVLIVSIELCTLHFQKIDDPDNITANLLFGDGAATGLVISDEIAAIKKLHGLKLRNFYSNIALTGKADMAWQLSKTGFLMTLSSYIPELIKQDINSLFGNALREIGISKSDISHWAIHPGGKKILEVIQEELGLNKNDLQSSWKVLENYGNMSSPTILFVLKDLLENKIDLTQPELTFAVGFGPGLTMESMILENV